MKKSDFQALLQRAIQKDGMIRKLALEYEVADSTVKRWADGISYPLERMRDVVARFIRKCGID